MNFSSKYMFFWMTLAVLAFGVDYLGLFEKMQIHGNSFAVGLVVGFIVMKLAPKVQDAKPEGKEQT